MQFPKMNSGEFPHIDNVNVNQWVNEFDYSRYDYTQMQIQICAVPWDMGEAHVGNRTISGIGNVVWFETKAKRDAWFDAIPDNKCFRFESKYKELHRDHFIDVPLPFDIASTYNYVKVKYSLFANDESPVMYESPEGHREWFWFIREVEFLAPNTTRLHLLEDAFQTWMYDVNVSGMMLERGHAPMFETTVDDYLADPIGNAENLLTEDVNYGTANDVAKASHEVIFNSGNMYALVFTTANVYGTWGSKSSSDWTTPGLVYNVTQSVNSYYVFAVPASSFGIFLNAVDGYVPQFLQTVKAVAFVSSDLLTIGASFEFAGVTCYNISASYTDTDIFESFDTDEFGYDERYASIAKLYTYPYAYILITDENGNETEVRIENTDGHISIQSNVNLVFPWLNIAGHLDGIGKSARKNITFANITTRNMPIQGNWFEHLMSWNIPTFGVIQDAGKNNDYATFYDRAQRVNDYTTIQTNENANADTAVANATLQETANTAITGYSNLSATYNANSSDTYNRDSALSANAYLNANATSTIQANEQQASVSAAASMLSSSVGALGSIASGKLGDAVTGSINGLIGGAATMASMSIGNALTSNQAYNASVHNTQMARIASTKTDTDEENQRGIASDITQANNDLIDATTANSAATMKANATRSAANSQAAIDNQIAQADIGAPAEFGAYNSGDMVSSRPMGLFANIVTQTDSAISAAGDEMLRYGYMFNKFWEFNGNWNIGKHFTYWKIKDFWVSNLNVPDMYMDRLRFFLMGGVTVWRKPEDIGNVTIYENL